MATFHTEVHRGKSYRRIVRNEYSITLYGISARHGDAHFYNFKACSLCAADTVAAAGAVAAAAGRHGQRSHRCGPASEIAIDQCSHSTADAPLELLSRGQIGSAQLAGLIRVSHALSVSHAADQETPAKRKGRKADVRFHPHRASTCAHKLQTFKIMKLHKTVTT
eukprot:350483-Chlamydomonas_euryale.AAC.3